MNKLLKFLLATTLFATPSTFAAVWEQSTKTALKTMMAYVNKIYDGDWYKGQIFNGNRGDGVYRWSNGFYYFGNFDANGNMNGYSMYMAPEGYNMSGNNNCNVFVGNFSSNKAYGKGTCYNEDGDLIYYGDFSYGKATGTYPSATSYPSYKFKTIDYSNGDKYVGETKDGNREGRGVYVWSNGNAWYGSWANDIRNGGGIFLSYDANLWETQRCGGDNCNIIASSRGSENNQNNAYKFAEALGNLAGALNAAQKGQNNNSYNGGSYYDAGSSQAGCSESQRSNYQRRYNDFKSKRDREAKTNEDRERNAAGKRAAHAIHPDSRWEVSPSDYRVINSSKQLIREYEREMDRVSREARQNGCSVY